MRGSALVWLGVALVASLCGCCVRPAAAVEGTGGLTADLARWLSRGDRPAKVSAKIEQDYFPGMGFGFKASEAVEANETLMEIPSTAFLSLKTAAEGPLKPVVLDLFESNCR